MPSAAALPSSGNLPLAGALYLLPQPGSRHGSAGAPLHAGGLCGGDRRRRALRHGQCLPAGGCFSGCRSPTTWPTPSSAASPHAGHPLDEGGRAGPLPLCGQPGRPRFRARHLALAARPAPGNPAGLSIPASPALSGLFCGYHRPGGGPLRTCQLTPIPSTCPRSTMFFQVIFLALLALLPMVNPPTTAPCCWDWSRACP